MIDINSTINHATVNSGSYTTLTNHRLDASSIALDFSNIIPDLIPDFRVPNPLDLVPNLKIPNPIETFKSESSKIINSLGVDGTKNILQKYGLSTNMSQNQLKTQLESLSNEQREQLAQELGVPSADLGIILVTILFIFAILHLIEMGRNNKP